MSAKIYLGESLRVMRTIPDGTARCCVTSPPYWGLRDYGDPDQLGAEPTPGEYVVRLVAILRELRRVLTPDGTLWLNLGDCYARKPVGRFNGGGGALAGRNLSGHAGSASFDTAAGAGLPEKNLVGIPWRVAFALQDDGWILRSDIIWAKPNTMPESVKDRPTRSHEYLFLLSKSARYHYDAAAIAEPISPASIARIRQPNFANQTGGEKDYRNGTNASRSMRKTLENFARKQDASGIRTYVGFNGRYDFDNPPATRNKRDVWTIPPRPYKGAHFATFPPALCEPCILAGSEPGDTIIDPFCGSGTAGAVAVAHDRRFIGIDLNPEYLELALGRIGPLTEIVAAP